MRCREGNDRKLPFEKHDNTHSYSEFYPNDKFWIEEPDTPIPDMPVPYPAPIPLPEEPPKKKRGRPKNSDNIYYIITPLYGVAKYYAEYNDLSSSEWKHVKSPADLQGVKEGFKYVLFQDAGEILNINDIMDIIAIKNGREVALAK